MTSTNISNKGKDNLASLLPSNLLSELDESINSTSKNTHKESNVSNFLNNLYFLINIVFL